MDFHDLICFFLSSAQHNAPRPMHMQFVIKVCCLRFCEPWNRDNKWVCVKLFSSSYVTSSYTGRSSGTVRYIDVRKSEMDNLKQRGRQTSLGMCNKINNGLVNINPASFCCFDPRTRRRSTKPAPGTDQTRPLSVCFLYSFWTELPPTSYFFQPLLSSPSQSLPGCSFHNLQPDPYTCPWTSRSCTVYSFIVRLSHLLFYSSYKTQGFDHDHFLNTRRCRTCNA